ncbi:transposase [Paraburkholderia antibiotica]|uniref:Transposase n=1 Tax=Paraburkholderia antibiotica TaxID=2728839 RepID=A0A7Y0FFG7_9BURK|nr:transposase [Paraburkholderia antibiotica]NML34216.1 transposase [Paraburkholderia antibiotica]
MTNYRDINDEEWQRVAELLPELRPRREMRGRPLANTREVLNGVLWVIYSGGVWSAMPRKYPSYQTCHRRFLAWNESGVLKRLLHELYGAGAEELCKTMQVRMRKHTMSARKSSHVTSGLRILDSLTPGVSQSPAYPASFKHAA